jgi:alkanesulfonate monooxygenase SsuD/methylene tetrahydromethanopterin reductase-like flavin-dependent oxidoreductase (luciferase family)
MEFGLMSLGDHLPDPATGRRAATQAERFREIVDYLVMAERLGFDAVHLGEHHFSHYIVSAPQMVLASVAEHTKKLKLSTGVTLLPHHDPLRIAEDFATLDVLSNGRAEVVIGRGVFPHTYKHMGQDIEQSRAMTDEGLDLLRLLWTGENVSWKGTFRAPLENVTQQPRPVQQPHPDIYLSGSSPDAVDMAARKGLPIAIAVVSTGFANMRDLIARYREQYRASGNDLANMKVAVSFHCHVDRDGAKARAYFGPHQFGYLNWVLSEIGVPGRQFPPTHTTLGNPDSIAIAGSPAQVIDDMSRWIEAAGGVDRLIIQSDQGGMPAARVRASVELFAAEVMPVLARQAQTVAA